MQSGPSTCPTRPDDLLDEALRELMDDDGRDWIPADPREQQREADREQRRRHREVEREERRRARRHEREERSARRAAWSAEPAPPATPAAPARRPRRRRRKLSAEERAYREAQRVANRKLSFVVHFVSYAMVCFFLLFVAGFRSAFIVAFSWGIGLAIHYVMAIIAPGLRQRWIDQEVSRRVTHTTTQQRQELHGAHARDLEDLSASIAHEIRNPITAAKSLVQQMGEDPGAGENVEYAHVALEELDRVERSISHLLRFAREQDVSMQPMSISDVVESALETFRDRIRKQGVTVERDLVAGSEMVGDPEQLRRVVINLFANALDALADSGTFSPVLLIQVGENLAGDAVWVRVKDNGPGIDPERMHKIFSPFYTSKDDGTGLGLAISKKVVDAHGGTIEAESAPGQGTEFVVTLPKQPAAPGERS